MVNGETIIRVKGTRVKVVDLAEIMGLTVGELLKTPYSRLINL